ncbi:hypothetical protein FKP32DRAFT_1391325 [Trametes sanguinea]|nr:hypothetical protein FKP32DRAFT_1391325 [Trametes sanguinea]
MYIVTRARSRCPRPPLLAAAAATPRSLGRPGRSHRHGPSPGAGPRRGRNTVMPASQPVQQHPHRLRAYPASLDAAVRSSPGPSHLFSHARARNTYRPVTPAAASLRYCEPSSEARAILSTARSPLLPVSSGSSSRTGPAPAAQMCERPRWCTARRDSVYRITDGLPMASISP